MNRRQLSLSLLSLVAAGALLAPALHAKSKPRPEAAQVPSWSEEDMEFFLHGSIGTEVIPERVLKAFMATYPELYPEGTIEAFGLAPDRPGRLPIGISRGVVEHLGREPSLGVNCASCHSGELRRAAGDKPVRVLGMTSHFDVDAFFGTFFLAMQLTAMPGNMKRYLGHYLRASDPKAGAHGQKALETLWAEQAATITATLQADPSGAGKAAPGMLHSVSQDELRLNAGLLKPGFPLHLFAKSQLRLFHNIRTILHVPYPLPDRLPPSGGPGRNNAFGLLAQGLLKRPAPHAPVKFGLVWNVGDRGWVHWDGNTSSPLIRNIAGALGLGAPLIGKRAVLDLPTVLRQTALTEMIRSPRYPFEVDAAAAGRGAAHYQARCARCHSGPEDDARLYPPSAIGTDAERAKLFDKELAEGFNKFFAELELEGYAAPKKPALRSTGKYLAADLRGVWARSPYLHNGSVRTLRELLSPAAARAKTFKRGTRLYDAKELGYRDEGAYVFDTGAAGNSNAGHEFGTDLPEGSKAELMEYLKTL